VCWTECRQNAASNPNLIFSRLGKHRTSNSLLPLFYPRKFWPLSSAMLSQLSRTAARRAALTRVLPLFPSLSARSNSDRRSRPRHAPKSPKSRLQGWWATTLISSRHKPERQLETTLSLQALEVSPASPIQTPESRHGGWL
jgi:hypothetical protein